MSLYFIGCKRIYGIWEKFNFCKNCGKMRCFYFIRGLWEFMLGVKMYVCSKEKFLGYIWFLINIGGFNGSLVFNVKILVWYLMLKWFWIIFSFLGLWVIISIWGSIFVNVVVGEIFFSFIGVFMIEIILKREIS